VLNKISRFNIRMAEELMMNFINSHEALSNSRDALVAASSEAMVAELEAAYINKKLKKYDDAAEKRLDAAMKAISQGPAGAAGGSSSRKQRKSRKSRKMRR
jgi:hypothetical protein